MLSCVRPQCKQSNAKRAEDEGRRCKDNADEEVTRLAIDGLLYLDKSRSIRKSTSIYWNEPYIKEVRSFMRVSNVTVRKRLTIVLISRDIYFFYY